MWSRTLTAALRASGFHVRLDRTEYFFSSTQTIKLGGKFLSATSESTFPFADFRFDGVLGLSLEEMGSGPEFSLISRLRRAALALPVFSVFLSESAEEESEIAFGGIDQSRMASDLFWIDVSKGPGYWEIKIDDFAIGGKKLGICEGCRVAIDTGTSELAGPTSVVDSLLSVLSIHKNCSNFDDLPNIGVHVGGHILGLARHDYVNQDTGSCEPSFMHMDIPPPDGPLLIFGIPFLTKFYTVFDMEKKRVGFSLAHHTTMNTELFVRVPTSSESPVQSGIEPHQRL